MDEKQKAEQTDIPPVNKNSTFTPAHTLIETPLKLEKKRVFVRTFILSTFAIFIVETVVMVFLEGILDIPEPLVWYIDGVILILILFPLNFYFIISPMLNQVEDRFQANQELVNTIKTLEGFFTISDVMIAYFDPDFNFIRVNKAYADYNQQPPEYFIGKNHFDLFPNQENKEIFTNVVKTGKVFHVIEKPFINPAHPEYGTTYWDWSLIPTTDTENTVYGLILALVDATERKRNQLALEQSEYRFRGVFNQTFTHLVLLNTDGQVLLVNQTARDFLNIQAKEIQGKYFWEIPWWDSSPSFEGVIKSHFQQAVEGEIINHEHEIFSATQDRLVMEITLKPLLDEQGNPILLVYEAHNVTQRIEAEKNLQESKDAIAILYRSESEARQESEALRNAALSLSSTLSKDTVLDTLLDHLFELVPYTSAHLYMVEDKNNMRAQLVRGDEYWPVEKRLQGKRLDITTEPKIQELLSSATIHYVPDTSEHKGSLYYPGNEFIGSWVSIPLLAGKQLVGLCILEHKEPHFFTPKMLELATTLTNQAAIAIQNAWLFEQVQYGREQLQALSRRLVRVQEAERQYIARELHDEAGQSIASLKVGLSLLERNSKNPLAVVSRSLELKNIADDVLENLHRISVSLRPSSLDHLGLVPAMQQHAESVGELNGLDIQFTVKGDIIRVPDETETAIYRILQEALTNVVRHAHATKVDILVVNRDEGLRVIIEDNGVGFDPTIPHLNHLGLVGMKERALMLGGSIIFETPPNGGTRIVLEVPCQSAS